MEGAESVIKETKVRGPEEFFKRIEAEAKNQGKSKNQMMLDLMEKGLMQQQDETPAMRLILLKYPARCLKCDCELPPQTWAMYGKGVGAVCLDCFIEKLGDKAIVKKVMRLKELKWTIKALEKELELKSDELRKLNFLEVIVKMRDGYGEIHKLILEYLKTGFDKSNKEKDALNDLETLIQKQWAIIEEAKLFLMGPTPLIKKKKKKKPYVA